MVGLESTLEQAETAKKVKKPEVAEAERERQNKFLAQLRERKPAKVAAAKPTKVKGKPKKGKRMTKASKGEPIIARFAAVKSYAQLIAKARLSVAKR
jgi:hypothetical protein